MDNMKILEQYANEFIEVIMAYNRNAPEFMIKKHDDLEIIFLVSKAKGIPVFGLKIENNSVKITEMFSNHTFYDSAPFLPIKMEVSNGN
jgi:hypothetical protein